MILVPTPNHTEQLWNAIQAEKLGIAEIIQQKELTREKLLKKVKQVLEGEMPERLGRIQKEVAKHDGLENAVKAVIKVAENEQVF
jgi:UDP:flavonoid glycosyltransferase YjiC (YdhE family)